MNIPAAQRLLLEALPSGEVHTSELLKDHTTFKVGGPAPLFVVPATEEELINACRVCQENDFTFRILGAGSNVLVSDDGISEIIIKVLDNLNAIAIEGNILTAQAGATNEAVSAAAQVSGLSGYEFACGIPGTIGGAAIMNAGAYEGEFKQVCTMMRCLTPRGEVVEVSAEQAQWGYRSSFMQDNGWIVLDARLELKQDDPAAIQARMDELNQKRSDKQPLEYGSAGSTFKRPEGYFAGKLIQDSGMKGFRIGDAQVSEKHSGFVINRDQATASEIMEVIHAVQKAVKENFDVDLELEVRTWGF